MNIFLIENTQQHLTFVLKSLTSKSQQILNRMIGRQGEIEKERQWKRETCIVICNKRNIKIKL